MRLNGYLDYKITHESFIIKKFNLFIRQLLSKLNTFPGFRLILILDNTRAYYFADLDAIYKEVKVYLKYLPAYSPDFNDIKKSFSTLKA
jgi:transposase